MEPDAIRPDRDVIGKQKNPRKRKLKRDESSLPSPGTESHGSQQEDALLNYLVDIEIKGNQPSSASFQNGFLDDCGVSSNIGIAHLHEIKCEPDLELYNLLQDRNLLDRYRTPMRPDAGRIADVEQFTQAMRRYIILAIDWTNALFALANLSNIHEKVTIIKNSFAAFAAFHKATYTAKLSPDQECIILCNGTRIPRDTPQHIVDTNLLANNMVRRILEELVVPIRKLRLAEPERVALTALILLEGDIRGISQRSVDALSMVKDKIQNALFQSIRERCDNSLNVASSRFANILLLLPSIAKVSAIYYENIQLAKMFGCQALDPLLAEIFLEAPVDLEPTGSPSVRTRFDASTQTIGNNDIVEDILNSTLTSSLLGIEETKNAMTMIEHNSMPIPSENSDIFHHQNGFNLNDNTSVSTIGSGKVPRPLIVPTHNQMNNSVGVNSAPPYNFYFSYPTSENPNPGRQQYADNFNMNNGLPTNTLGSHSAGPFGNSHQNAFFETSQTSNSQSNDFSSFKFL